MGMSPSEVTRFTSIIDRYIAPLGYLCLRLEWDKSDKTLRVYIKRSDPEQNSNINIEDCVKATKVLRQADELDQIENGDFVLEVSSPGIDDTQDNAE